MIRVIVIGFYNRNNTLLKVLCNVYMPFFDARRTCNTVRYIDTINVLQSVMDKYSAECLVKMVEDLKKQLPQSESCHATWYQSKCFNKHSVIFFNFMCSNNLSAADVLYTQSLNNAYFCYKSVYLVGSCFVHAAWCWLSHRVWHLEAVANNNSDHLLISVTFYLEVCSDTNLSDINAISTNFWCYSFCLMVK